MTLPESVRKELDDSEEWSTDAAIHYYPRSTVERLCELTRRETLEEAARECEKISKAWTNYAGTATEPLGCAAAIRALAK